jgi:hypothetical protein
MDDWLQWAITAIIGILGIIAGRAWERYDRKLKKDQELIQKILTVTPLEGDDLSGLRTSDFGGAFRRDIIRMCKKLDELLGQPNSFFLDKKLEMKRLSLVKHLKSFIELVGKEAFTDEIDPQFMSLNKPHKVAEYKIREFITIHHEKPSDDQINQMDVEADEYHQRTRNQLNTLANDICKDFDDIIKSAHRQA